ncbi:MAG: fused MFS/spermidine synthase [Nitrospinaceae bacterium]|nr:fused MFS/spermidine synthase [Nitrospinaceae bacterium]
MLLVLVLVWPVAGFGADFGPVSGEICQNLYNQPPADPKLANLVEYRASSQNPVYVLEQNQYLIMSFGAVHDLQSMYNPKDELEVPLVYQRIMSIGAAYPKNLKKVLMLGLGGGRLTQYLRQYLKRAEFTVVELDPAVISVAKAHFGVQEKDKHLKIVQADAWEYLKDSKDKFDLILVDVCVSDTVPPQVKSADFYKEVKAHLAKGGTAVQNVSLKHYYLGEAEAAMREAFGGFDSFETDMNFILVAPEMITKHSGVLSYRAKSRQKKYSFRYPLGELLGCFHRKEPISD